MTDHTGGRGIGAAVKTFEAPDDYVQGRGVAGDLGTYAAPLGDVAFLFADDTVAPLLDEAIESLESAGVSVETARFGGECSAGEVDRLAALARAADADFVVGAGGGKANDAGKAVGDELGIGVVSLATIAATDAPTSALAVMYTDDGEWADYRFTARHPDLVVVDTELVAAAPTRLFTSGIADALSTWYEVDASYRRDGTNMARFPGNPTRLAHAIARLAADVIREHGVAATRAVERGAVTDAVEAVVEANVLLGGLGFENGGVAAAHSVHNGLTKAGVHDATHGEKVNFGVLTQLLLEGKPDAEIAEFVAFSRRLDLPLSFADLGVDPDDETLDAIARAATATDPYTETVHNAFDVTWRDVRDAMVAADEVGRAGEST
jgi:glycerol dehydrogenase